MTSWPDARQVAHSAVSPLPGVAVPLEKAAGRTLAADLLARAALPPFDAAAMDGWAVRGAGPWTVVGKLLAGDPAPAPLADGTAVEIATGAVVPAGTEGVLPYEQGPLETARHPGELHIRRAGEECSPGDLLLRKGSVLSPAGVGLAAAVGHDELLVRRRPQVSCFVTGSELLCEGLPEAGRIRDAVGPLLLSALAGYGASVATVQHLPDDRAALLRALKGVDADLAVTTGASSSGPADHLSEVLEELGASVLIDGVDIKPGHPQLLSRLPTGTLLVGLPGNPLAALAGLVTLVEPLLCGLLGRPLPDLGSATLAGELTGHPRSHRLVPVALSLGIATPTGHGGAAMLRGAATADALAVLEPGGVRRPGAQVAVVPLR
ncbi:MAG: molybdopterin molybdenumtransferase MoeA [Frankiales bacterium]|nr:molybdopterin molybdenumtransferase MoeA [Frankiales bacterium]